MDGTRSITGHIVFGGVWEDDGVWTEWMDPVGVDTEALQQLATSLFQRIDRSYDHQKPFAPYQGFVFQYLVEDERAFLAAATEGIPQRVSYAFLQKIKEEYFSHFVDTQKKAVFQKVIQEQAKYFSESPDVDPLRTLRKKVDDVIVDMTDNVRKLNIRGDDLEQLAATSQLLEESSQKLHSETKALRCKLCRDNLKATIIASCSCTLILVILVILILIFTVWSRDSPNTTQTPPATFSTHPSNFTATTTSSSATSPSPSFSPFP